MNMSPTKVLLAIDGSREAERASRSAVELADKTGSELHLIYVPSITGIRYSTKNSGKRPCGGSTIWWSV